MNKYEAHTFRELLSQSLDADWAHKHFLPIAKAFDREQLSKRPPSLPHSPWELMEHIRLVQIDILRFCTDPRYASPEWPEEFWPRQSGPSEPEDWDKSVDKFMEDLEAIRKLILDESTDLLKPIPHGEGQNILREILVLNAHNSYHIGQLMDLYRLFSRVCCESPCNR